MKLSTNPDSRAYAFCWVEGLTVTVVIDEKAEGRTVRIVTDHTPAIDPRQYSVELNHAPFGQMGRVTLGGGPVVSAGSGRASSTPRRVVAHTNGEVIIERTPAAFATYIRNQPYADFSGEEGEIVISALAEFLEELVNNQTKGATP